MGEENCGVNRELQRTEMDSRKKAVRRSSEKQFRRPTPSVVHPNDRANATIFRAPSNSGSAKCGEMRWEIVDWSAGRRWVRNFNGMTSQRESPMDSRCGPELRAMDCGC